MRFIKSNRIGMYIRITSAIIHKMEDILGVVLLRHLLVRLIITELYKESGLLHILEHLGRN